MNDDIRRRALRAMYDTQWIEDAKKRAIALRKQLRAAIALGDSAEVTRAIDALCAATLDSARMFGFLADTMLVIEQAARISEASDRRVVDHMKKTREFAYELTKSGKWDSAKWQDGNGPEGLFIIDRDEP